MSAIVTSTPPMNFVSRSGSFNCSDTEIIDTAFALAMYYIPYYFRELFPQEDLRGLPKQFLVPPQQPPPELFRIILKLCTQMRLDNATFFQKLPERVNLDAKNAQEVFFEVASEMFADGKNNWGRVIALYTLAGCLSAHLVQQRQLNIVKLIPFWLKKFVDDNLVDWIQEQGGWKDLLSTFSETGNLLSWSKFIAVGSVFAATAGLFLMSKGLR